MATIYALQGTGATGKSTTLNLLIGTLIQRYPNANASYLLRGKDMKVIISGAKGQIVGIETQGDPNSRLQDSLEDFLNASCDVIFCACRNWGMTCDWIKNHCPPNTCHFIPKTIAKNHTQNHNANITDVQILLERSGF